MNKINIDNKFKLFDDHWSPKIIGELNGQAVKIAKVQGEFVWHNHENEDELFFVVKGQLKIEIENEETVELGVGEMVVIPRGVNHKPVAEDEVWVMLFEPSETKHTGDVRTEKTVDIFERI